MRMEMDKYTAYHLLPSHKRTVLSDRRVYYVGLYCRTVFQMG